MLARVVRIWKQEDRLKLVELNLKADECICLRFPYVSTLNWGV
jgi:hypothetical protein